MAARDRLAALRAQQSATRVEESFPEPTSVPMRPRLSSRASFEERYEVTNYRSPSPEQPSMGPFSNPFEERAPPRALPQAQLPTRRPSDPMGTPRASQISGARFEHYTMATGGYPADGHQRRSSVVHQPTVRRSSLVAVATSGAAQRRTHAYQTSNAHTTGVPQYAPQQTRRDTQSSFDSMRGAAAAPPYTPGLATAGQSLSEKFGLGISDSVDTSMEAFFNELARIQSETREYEDTLTRIETLHSRELSTVPDSNEAHRVATEFTRVTNESLRLSSDLKRRLQMLERTNGLGRDLSHEEKNVKRTQTAGAKNRFISAIQRYSSIESDHRAACRQRLAKQYRVVNPHATDAEVKQACGATDGGIFTAAFLGSARSESARAALSAVQARQADLARIEHTISELAQLFNDMAFMVEEQQDQIVAIEGNAQKAENDMEAAVVDLHHAKLHALSARKRRWIILGIVSAILLIVAAVVTIFILKNEGVFNRQVQQAWVVVPSAVSQPDTDTQLFAAAVIADSAQESTASAMATPAADNL